MANLKINGLKGSEVLEIKAAVVKVMESAAGVEITEDPDITEERDGTCQMSFRKKQSSLAELTKIYERLGRNFGIELIHQKDATAIVLNAPKEDFAKLIGKQMQAKQPDLNFTPKEENKQQTLNG